MLDEEENFKHRFFLLLCVIYWVSQSELLFEITRCLLIVSKNVLNTLCCI